MSHSDLVLVRADIKSWERRFAATHGRDPSLQDIRDQPHIAEKYRLYKKLSKPAPPRLPAPKSPPADSVPPPRFNPFSPVKKSARAPPFATPAKNKPRPRTATPSPRQVPSLLLPDASANGQSAPTTAVSRARKRLRGEPVSPSPNKPKRQRLRSQPSPPSPKLGQDDSSSEHEPEQELPQCDFTSSFVADSPVKAPASGKSFKLLFDDALPTCFLAQSDPRPAFLSAPTSLQPYVTSGPVHRADRLQAKPPALTFPTKDHPSVPSHKPAFKPTVSQVPQPKASNKRVLDSSNPVPSRSQYPLVPPSPPPQESTNRDASKAKAKATAGRKRLRVNDQESGEDVDSPDDLALKVSTVRSDRGKPRHADDLDSVSLLHLGARDHDPAAEEQIDANHHASGTFSVDLPDEFHRVLAITPPRNRNSTEERVVRGLLHGDRVGHYDPFRGGDIWDAGETDEGALGDAETEDDWEGEPVPWEVGEL